MCSIIRILKLAHIGHGTIIDLRKLGPLLSTNALLSSGSLIFGSLVGERGKLSTISVGRDTFIGSGTVISAAKKVRVGNNCLISNNCYICDHNSHSLRMHDRRTDVKNYIGGKKNWKNIEIKPTVIGNDVWVGYGSIILKGVSIGDGAIVGAGSIVTKNILKHTIVAGNPAKLVRKMII